MLCGSGNERRAGEYMAEVRTSSQCERPCAGIEETHKAPRDAGGSKDPGQRKVHSLIDKVYAPADLAEAWRHVRVLSGLAPISTQGTTYCGYWQRSTTLFCTDCVPIARFGASPDRTTLTG